jgi:septal ring factor EnvC (AmiA/AmiB activator)
MPDITKQDIKDAVIEVLEPFAKSIQADFQGVNKRLDGHDAAFAGINQQLGVIETGLAEVKGEVKEIKADLAEVKAEVKEMKDNSSQLFAKLDEFISLYKNQESENRSLASQLARLEERVSKLEAK